MKRLRRQIRGDNPTLIGVAIFAFVALCACSTITLSIGLRVVDWLRPDDVLVAEPPAGAITWAPDSAELTVAVSPIMAPTLRQRVEAFNDLNRETPDGTRMQVTLAEVAPEEMVEQSLAQPPFQAIVPDSSLWLGQINQRWATAQATEPGDIAPQRVGEPVRFAVSPIVIAAWEDVARDLGWPDRAVGWEEIQRKATDDPNFKWNHPSTQHAAGMLATLAEFYAGAGITRGLTEEIATRQDVLDYVREVEATVRFYGEGEDVIVTRLSQEGRAFLDAFVAQEQTVIHWNTQGNNNRLVALYPAEGTLWVDHPLALLELGGDDELAVTDNQRLTFSAFADFLTSEESQQAFLRAGYRPADLDIELNAEGSPFANTDAVDWQQPKTTLQIPPAPVVEVIQNVWRYTKRPTNVYLVVDTSGSMEGEKMERARVALRSFVEQIQGDRDKVGIVEFGSGVKRFEPLRTVTDEGRATLQEIISGMEAWGNTALIDGIWEANRDLQIVADDEAINAIVVMTDGQENDSYYSLSDLSQSLQQGTVPVVVFTIAFGRDADEDLLREIAQIGGGQFRRADETDIEELYQIISTYF